MTLKFLVDESSGKILANYLKEKGYDVVFVADIMVGSSDLKVLEKSEKENRILVTNDKDLGKLIFRLGRPSFGVILLRPRTDSPLSRVELINMVLTTVSDKLKKHFVVATEDKIRLKKLG